MVKFFLHTSRFATFSNIFGNSQRNAMSCTGNKFINLRSKKIHIYFYYQGQNHNLGYEQFHNLGHDYNLGHL